MDETDFDALCEGGSPHETKRLRKILSQWCQGDEQSFPVQLALLTRAQWRSAARVPALVTASRQQMENALTEHRQKTTVLLDGFTDNVSAEIRALEQVITAHAEATKKAGTETRVQLTHAETAADRIQAQLDRGALEWKIARSAFETERQSLQETVKELELRSQWRNSVCFIAVAAGLVMLGIIIGMHIVR